MTKNKKRGPGRPKKESPVIGWIDLTKAPYEQSLEARWTLGMDLTQTEIEEMVAYIVAPLDIQLVKCTEKKPWWIRMWNVIKKLWSWKSK